MAEQAGLGFGGLLRQLRDGAGLTQEELAEAARVSQRAVSDLERGINRTARKDTALLLAGALGLDGQARALFVSAARGRTSAGDVLAIAHRRPPGASASAQMLPNNLPAQLASFVGREQELADVGALVRSSRLVTLTGAGGCGKTRLALQLADGLLDGPGDGVWLVELAAVTDQEAVPAAICRALGIAAEPGRPARDTLLDALAPQNVFIVLDNCEHLVGGCAKTAEALVRRCPHVHLMATSREPLGIGGEVIYRVPPLSLPEPGDSGLLTAGSSDAVALFIERARAQGTGLLVNAQTAPLVISICRRPDQGNWLRRLDADQANFRRAAEHAAGLPDGTSQALRFGVALWRYWLVRRRNDEAAALLVPTLRRPEAAADPALFAEALAAAAFLTAFTDLATSLRLAEQADQVADRLGDDRLLALSRSTLAWGYCWAAQRERALPLTQEAVERARRLGDDVLLGTCLRIHAHAVGATASGPLYAEAIACTERSGDIGLRQILHNNAGWDALEIGDIPAARAHLEASIRTAEAIGDPHPAPAENLGWVLRAEHDLDGARSRFEEALQAGRRIGSKRGMATAINGLASLATDLSDWHRAAVLHGAAQALLDQTGAQWEGLDDRYRQASLGQARAALDDAQAQRAYACGMALSLDQIIDVALGGIPPGA